MKELFELKAKLSEICPHTQSKLMAKGAHLPLKKPLEVFQYLTRQSAAS